jgi:DNA polymerase III subunit chi
MAKVVLHRLAGAKKALEAARLVESLACDRHRVVVYLSDAARAGTFDQFLWTFSQGSFVPHAQWDGNDEQDDPVVLLAGALVNPNHATHLVAVDRPANLAEAGVFEVVHDLITPGDEEEGARGAWVAAGFEVDEARGVPVREE